MSSMTWQRSDPYSGFLFQCYSRAYEAALADFSTEIALSPRFDMAWRRRGQVRLDMRDHDRALADLDEAVRLSPRYFGALSDRGAAWLGKKDARRALADLDEAIRLGPKYAPAYR